MIQEHESLDAIASGTRMSKGVATLLVLCRDELDYTRLCLDSVLRLTGPSFELILVNNASSDGTATFLEEVCRQPGPVRVEVIHNGTNLGYAAACNQALARAQGEYVVFLNNDTIVTEGWLEGLIAWAEHEYPSVGLVGPVTNYAPPPQKVEVDYSDFAGLHAFAAHRQSDFARRAVAVPRLSGFCLLARRDVLEKIGGFDERFGLGFFEDDDLCFRAADAGYRLLLALNVFVHHFGSRTFRSQGIDTEQLLRTNFEKFREKWGPERTAGYHFPVGRELAAGSGQMAAGSRSQTWSNQVHDMSAVSPLLASHGPPPTERGRVSLCMIVKNEQANLPACLESVRDLVDEIVVADTGSTDSTRPVAEQFGAKVYEFPWIDSFAAARNESIRHATGDWIFWLDADDRLDEDNRTRLTTLFANLKDENAAYVMKCLCLPDPVSKTATVVDHVRLFRNHAQVRWQYRVHEQILPSIRRLNGDVRWSDVTIHHAGYQDVTLRRQKLQRDLRLLQMDLPEHYDDPFILFNLGSIYQELGRTAEAIPLLQRSLERSHPNDSIVRKLYALLCQAHRQLGQFREALAACQAGRRLYPDDIELLFHEGVIRHALRDFAGAEACLQQVLQTNPGEHFASVDAGLRGYKARHNLAIVYRDQGRFPEAEAQWRAAVEEQSNFVPGWLGLGELAVAESRWQDAEETAARLENGLQAPLDAAVLRGRSLLAQKNFPAAQQLFRDAADQFPQALWPRVLLSHAYLQEGRDWPAAEQALRDVLALDPANAEARRNLAILLQQQNANGRPPVVAVPINQTGTPGDET